MSTVKSFSSYSAVIKISLIAALGGFLFGYDTAVINGAVNAIASAKTGFGLSPNALGFAVASVLGGAAIGAAFAGIAAAKVGRVRVMIVAAALFCVSAVGSGLSYGLWEFVFWRVVGGVGVGIAAVISPAYIAEVAPAHLRGRLGSLTQLAIAVGLFASFVCNALIAYQAGSPEHDYWLGLTAWRWMLIVEVIPALLYGLMALKLPESPRYLVSKGKVNEALHILAKFTNDQDPKQRVQLIQASLTTSTKLLSDFRAVLSSKTGLVPIVWVALGLAVIAQFSGINIILYYASSLWIAVGFSSALALAVPIGTTTIGILMTLVGMFLIDRIGRKKLLVVGSIGMAVTLIATGLIFFSAIQNETGLVLEGHWAWLALFTAHMFYIFFCGTWGPALWVVLGEIFPNSIRTMGLAVATCGNWIGNVVVTWSFPSMMAAWGLGNTYLFYGICCLFSLVLIVRWIPETNGKQLEDMDLGTNEKATKTEQ